MWDAAACQYQITDRSHGCRCSLSQKNEDKDATAVTKERSLKQSMFYNTYFLLDAPSVLHVVIETNRVIAGAINDGCMIEGRINKTLVNIDEFLVRKTSKRMKTEEMFSTAFVRA